MTLFQTLLKAQAPTNFEKSEEYSFYKRNINKLNEHEPFANIAKKTDSFGVVRANIILKSIINKEEIEKRWAIESKTSDCLGNKQISEESISRILDSLPYLILKGEKIYVPMFPSALASLYSNSFAKLSVSPYKKLLSNYDAAVIDPFDYYGHALFESKFTNLLLIKKRNDVIAMYDQNAECVYFINEQGRLDNVIALFDKYLKNPNKDHVLRRAKGVVDAYFDNDREGMLNALLKEKLISEKIYKSLVEEKR